MWVANVNSMRLKAHNTQHRRHWPHCLYFFEHTLCPPDWQWILSLSVTQRRRPHRVCCVIPRGKAWPCAVKIFAIGSITRRYEAKKTVLFYDAELNNLEIFRESNKLTQSIRPSTVVFCVRTFYLVAKQPNGHWIQYDSQ